MPSIWRGHYEIYSLYGIVFHDLALTEICYQGSSLRETSIGYDNGLAQKLFEATKSWYTDTYMRPWISMW